MDQERFENLEKKVDYLNAEGFAGEGKQFMLFSGADAAIEAIRNNQVPGIIWDEESERKWNESNHLEQCYNESRTEEDDLND